jgi:GTPase SAR1 family protein
MIRKKLSSGEVVIKGDGGMGKSTLAAKYVEDHRGEYDGGVFWLYADSNIALFNSYRRLASTLKVHLEDKASDENVLTAIKRAISSTGRC